MREPLSGTYRHYKGKEYTVLGVARYTETEEMVVVYQARYDSPEFGNRALWVRPLSEFTGTVLAGDTEVARFVRIGD